MGLKNEMEISMMNMKFLLSIAFEVLLSLPFSGCGASQYGMQTNIVGPLGYEIVIKLFDNRNSIDKIMDMFNRNGMIIMKVNQTYLSAEWQEMRVSIKGGDKKQLNETVYQLRCVLNVESVSIFRL